MSGQQGLAIIYSRCFPDMPKMARFFVIYLIFSGLSGCAGILQGPVLGYNAALFCLR
jgi:hypothetical protein